MPSRFNRFINLDGFPRHIPPVQSIRPKDAGQYQVMNYASALHVLRLLARGSGVSDIAFDLNMAESQVRRVAVAVATIGARLTLNATLRDDRSTTHSTDFLRRITHDGWRRLGDVSIRQVNSGVARAPISVISEMIGRRRQVVMWNEETFRLGRWLVDSFGIAEDRCVVVASNTVNDDFLALAAHSRFAVKSHEQYLSHLKESSSATPRRRKSKAGGLPPKEVITPAFQVDTVTLGPEQFSPRIRCALVVRERGDEDLRNSLEFLVAALALAAAASVT